MATSDRQGRTRMCSVVFLDIAGFTQQSVARQVNVKSHLEELITRALADVPETDLVIVDTGDGAVSDACGNAAGRGRATTVSRCMRE